MKDVIQFHLDTPRHKRLRKPTTRPKQLQEEFTGLPPLKSASSLVCMLPIPECTPITKKFQRMIRKAIGMYKVDKVFRKVHRNRTVDEAIEIILGNKPGVVESAHAGQLAQPSEGPVQQEQKPPMNSTRYQTEDLQHEDAFVEEPEEHSIRIDYSAQETFGM